MEETTTRTMNTQPSSVTTTQLPSVTETKTTARPATVLPCVCESQGTEVKVAVLSAVVAFFFITSLLFLILFLMTRR